MEKDRLAYNTSLRRLELKNKTLWEGELLEIYVLGYWLSGSLALDSSGWYLVRPNNDIGIRLRVGMLARYPQDILFSP